MIGSLTYRSVEAATLVDLIGNTPLLRLPRSPAVSPQVEIFAKAEWYNPGGSVKDRAALSMIRDGERSGALTRGKTIIDATSGNTGIAYAMIGATLGYRVKLAIPGNAGPERKRILSAYGADVIYTDPMEGTDGAQARVKQLVAESPDEYFYPDQYNNPANWMAHYRTTAIEIYDQTGRAVTHFVAGIGTSGTFVGTSRRLKELNPAIRCISFQPDTPLHGLEGLKHLQTAIVPGIYDAKLADEHLEVATDSAHEMARRLAKTEGILVGVSSAASMVAALGVAAQLSEGIVVTVFPDHGSRYLSERFWEE
jgi:cysteine synthase B